ncbi:hypothetical protein PSDVSF_10040 [Pseudodesulfovibrio sediminis]|uniref:Uncharacterized protein n=1 Tax=Pseudodesulfovibrio sediminis TaxID=2810563 RepID=A0ABM7P4R7_9BACT|nr:hypothetical protein PSDVSF_10040 [Pseudodesulfovibrio sediminis]
MEEAADAAENKKDAENRLDETRLQPCGIQAAIRNHTHPVPNKRRGAFPLPLFYTISMATAQTI